MSFTIWESLVKTELGVNPKERKHADRLAMKKLSTLLNGNRNDYERAKMEVILDRIPDHRAKPKLDAARRRQAKRRRTSSV